MPICKLLLYSIRSILNLPLENIKSTCKIERFLDISAVIMYKDSPIFKTARVTKNIWRIINTIVSISTAWIFDLKHYLFLKATSFPRATLSENCSLFGTDIVRGQISEHIFTPYGGYCLFSTKTLEDYRWSSEVIRRCSKFTRGLPKIAFTDHFRGLPEPLRRSTNVTRTFPKTFDNSMICEDCQR